MVQEKKYGLTLGDIIKLVVFVAAFASAWAAFEAKNSEQDKRIDKIETENKELRNLIGELNTQTSELNGKMDVMLNYVKTINEHYK